MDRPQPPARKRSARHYDRSQRGRMRHVAPQSDTRKRRRVTMAEEKPSFGRRAMEWVFILVLAIALSSFVRAFLMQAFWIPSSSMEDTLQIGDNVAVSRLTPGPFELKRGDVVVFRDTAGWLPPMEEDHGWVKVRNEVLEFTGLRPASGEQHLVKRVIGLSGDQVRCCDPEGKLQVNGISITEPYLAPGSDNSTQPFDVTVPEGHIWVMGDNRNHSADSRAHMQEGERPYIALDDVVGKVFWITWPFDHWANPTDNEPFAELNQ